MHFFEDIRYTWAAELDVRVRQNKHCDSNERGEQQGEVLQLNEVVNGRERNYRRHHVQRDLLYYFVPSMVVGLMVILHLCFAIFRTVDHIKDRNHDSDERN